MCTRPDFHLHSPRAFNARPKAISCGFRVFVCSLLRSRLSRPFLAERSPRLPPSDSFFDLFVIETPTRMAVQWDFISSFEVFGFRQTFNVCPPIEIPQRSDGVFPLVENREKSRVSGRREAKASSLLVACILIAVEPGQRSTTSSAGTRGNETSWLMYYDNNRMYSRRVGRGGEQTAIRDGSGHRLVE